MAAVNLPPAFQRQCRRTEMKTLLLAGATLALLTAVNFSPSMAQEPKPSGGNT
jgi:hypothetical protein